MVLNISSKPKNRNWLARNEQRKVLMLVFLLGGVFWAMNEARDPKMWQFIFAGSNSPNEKTKQPPIDNKPIDTRLHKKKSASEKIKGLVDIDVEAVKPDSKQVKPITNQEPKDSTDGSDNPITKNNSGTQEQQNPSDAVDLNQERDVSFDPKQDYFPGVKSAYFEYIRDDVPLQRQFEKELRQLKKEKELRQLKKEKEVLVHQLHKEKELRLLEKNINQLEKDLRQLEKDLLQFEIEKDVLLHFLDILKTTKSKTLIRASKETVSFRQLHEQRDHYRGKLVTISGNAKSCSKISLKKNSYGISHVYQIVVFPTGGSPVSVYCLNLPEGFPEGTNKLVERDQEIRLTGFFYKRAEYIARGVDDKGERRLWPVLLAKDFSWQKPEPVLQKVFDQFTYLMIAAFSLVLAMIVVTHIYFKSKKFGSKAESYHLAKLNINEEVSLTDIKANPELSFDSTEEVSDQHPSQ